MMWLIGLGRDMRAMIVRYTEVGKRRDLRVNVDKSQVMVFGGDEG